MTTCCNFVKTNMALLKCNKHGFKCTQALKNSATLKLRNVHLLLLMSKFNTQMITKTLLNLSRRWKQHLRSSLDYYLSLPNLFITYKWTFVPSGATGVDPGILKSGGALCRPPSSADEKHFSPQML